MSQSELPTSSSLASRISSWLTTPVYVLGTVLINGLLLLALAQLRQSPAYAWSTLFQSVLPWAIAANVMSSAVLLSAQPEDSRKRFVPLLRLCDWLCALLPLSLIVVFRRPQPIDDLQQVVGFIYTASLFARLAVFAILVQLLRNRQRKIIRLAIFATSFIVYFSFAPWVAISATTNGDEPHYLLLAHSLSHDHAFDLRNNYDNRDYKAFYPYDLSSRPDHHIITNHKGQQMPFHDVGLSVILVPGYLPGGRLGAMVEINLFAAAAAAGIFELALELGATTASAITAWALFAFVSPVITFSSQIYPEIPCSALTLWAAVAFARYFKEKSARALLMGGCLLALGPWLSVRYWMVLGPMSCVVATYLVTQRQPRKILLRSLAWITLPSAISLLAFCIFDYRLFGLFEPNAGYILFVPTTAYPMFRPQAHVGLLGLFFDKSFGLLPTAPIYLVAIAGIWPALREQRVLAVTVLAPVVSTILFTAPNHWWYGGVTPPPSRYIVVALAPLAAFARVMLSRIPWKALVPALALWSFLVAFQFMAFPIPRHSFWDTTATGIVREVYRHWRLNLASAFPSFLQPLTRDYVLAAIWAAVAGMLIALLGRRRQARAPEQTQSLKVGVCH
jgi:hypothetical protein